MQSCRNKFLIFDDVRIKLGNIKSYGISDELRYYEKLYTKVYRKKVGWLDGLLGNTFDLIWNGEVELIDSQRYFFLGLRNADDRQDCQNIHVDNIDWYYSEYGNTYKKIIDGKNIIYHRLSQYYATLEEVIEKHIRYLYIETYQNDNFRFYEDEVSFDIVSKCKEIDKILTYN